MKGDKKIEGFEKIDCPSGLFKVEKGGYIMNRKSSVTSLEVFFAFLVGLSAL